ncbi:MAG: hypothetical protein HOV80_19995 [Polyangiaceae bacterium]|nr:hypothetical protein [Polyangiaceae bacterium]
MRLPVTLCVLLLLACNESEPETETEPEPTPESGCGEEIPVLTWEGFAQGFLITHCQGCHASTSPDRHDAPENVTFDTEEEALAWKERILTTAGTEPYTMPPAGGPTPEDRERLVAWLTCASD